MKSCTLNLGNYSKLIYENIQIYSKKEGKFSLWKCWDVPSVKAFKLIL